jgi:chemotaxis-related protein WspB
MLFLVFQLGTDRYAIDAAQVVEILPLVNAKRIPHTLPGVTGIIDYHGLPVPLIDLTELTGGTPSRKWMSTRIILVNYPGTSGKVRRLALLAEHVTETMRRAEEDFTDPGIESDAPYLGPVTTDAAGIIQQIRIKDLLPADVGDRLFRERVESL